MTKSEVVAELRTCNKGAEQAQLALYADVYLEYQVAQANIAEHGTVVFHPKTGAPIRNPYLEVRDAAWNRLQKSDLRTGKLWEGK